MTFTDIKNRTYFLTNTDSTQYPIADLVISANRAVERIVSLINRCDSKWQWDDLNQTDLPIGTTALVSGQKDYSLQTSHLTIDRVEVKDSAGNWHRVNPIDRTAIEGQSLTDYKKSNGLPEEYDLIGSSVFLYPSPNYSQASSLKIYFTRGPVAFDSDDTTETPGFNSLFHDLIPLWIAYDYAIAKGKDNPEKLFKEIERKERELYDFYGLRDRDYRPRLTTSKGDSNK